MFFQSMQKPLSLLIFFCVVSFSLSAQKVVFEAAKNLPGKRVSDIALESGRRLWVATDKGVACLTEGAKPLYFVDSTDATKFNANVIEIDRYNHKWIGTQKGEVIKISNFSTQTYQTMSVFESDPQSIISLSVDEEQVWVGSSQGKIAGYNFSNQSNVPIETFYVGPIHALYAEGTQLEFAARGNGLFRSGKNYKNSKWKEYANIAEAYDIKKRGNTFGVLGKDYSGGTLLLSSDDLEDWKKHDVSCLQGENTRLYEIDFDNVGNLWIGSGAGVLQYNPATGSCKMISQKNVPAFPMQAVHSIVWQNDSVVWIASPQQGLYQMKVRSWEEPAVAVAAATEIEEEKSIQRKKSLISISDIRCNDTLELSKLIFRPNSTDFLNPAASEETLDIVYEYLDQHPNENLELYGHTNNLSDNTDFLMQLSEQRVEAVKKYLVTKGIKKGRITTLSFGGTKPIISEGTAAMREINRRVELMVRCN